jgi:curved DNA-binding protein CbpA
VIRDYYSILGLRPDSSSEAIKKVYRKLAMQYHPDRNGGNPESEERLKEINEAYQILGDEEKRRRYDLRYRQPLENNVSYAEYVDDDFVNVLRMFSQMGFVTKRSGGCRRGGLGRGGCGRWKKDFL